MRKLILHCGFHKTGTSAIQRALASNRSTLEQNGYTYPDTSPFEAHHNLASRLLKERSVQEHQDDVRRTFSSWQSQTENTVIFSSEMFCEGLAPIVLAPLGELFEEVDVVFYVREQCGLLQSAYNQQVKQNGEARRIDEYTAYLTDQYAFIKNFQDELMSFNFRIFSYDLLSMRSKDAVSDFFENVLKIDTKHLKLDIAAPVNNSLSTVACAVLARVNRVPFDQQYRKSLIDYLFAKFPADKYRNFSLLSDSYRDQLIAKCSESNSRLSKEYLNGEVLRFPEKKASHFISNDVCDALIIASDTIPEIARIIDIDANQLSEYVLNKASNQMELEPEL